MREEHREKHVYRDREPAFYEHLESLLEAGFSELVEDDHIYHVSLRRSEDSLAHPTYFVLQLIS